MVDIRVHLYLVRRSIRDPSPLRTIDTQLQNDVKICLPTCHKFFYGNEFPLDMIEQLKKDPIANENSCIVYVASNARQCFEEIRGTRAHPSKASLLTLRPQSLGE
jgi:hypothetical protein